MLEYFLIVMLANLTIASVIGWGYVINKLIPKKEKEIFSFEEEEITQPRFDRARFKVAPSFKSGLSQYQEYKNKDGLYVPISPKED